jgi:hypothetical protein
MPGGPAPLRPDDDRRDGPGLCKIFGTGVGDAEVADQAGVAQLGQRADVFGDRGLAGYPQVHQVEMVAAELAKILLDLPS